MVHIQNALIFAVLSILAGALTQASDVGHRPPHIHGPMFPPHVIGRPPHSHEEVPPIPAEAEERPPHIHDEAPPPLPHDWPFEYDDEPPMELIDAELPLVPSNAVEPRASSDTVGKPPHIDDESPLGLFTPEERPPHIHDHSPMGPTDAERRLPHIHGPMFPPHIIGRPPHSHEEVPPIPADVEERPPHIHDEAQPPIPHDWPFEYDFHDELPMVPDDAESSGAVEPRALSDTEGKPPHIDVESPLGAINPEGRPPHNHDQSSMGPSDAERKRPQPSIHRPKFPPHIIGRPPHSQQQTTQVPKEAGYRSLHILDEVSPPVPQDWPFENNFHDEPPMVPSDAVEPRVSSDAESRPPQIHDPSFLGESDAEGRPPHIHDESPLGPFNPEGRPPHIHDDPHVPYVPFQHKLPDWGHFGSWVHWTPCDIDAGPRVRCQDCRTKLICTRLGGFVFEYPNGSYCNDGLWSDVPSKECV